ncbi:MAG: nicotinate-nucleotide diphosphorylase, partial [Myxococcales bacterium]
LYDGVLIKDNHIAAVGSVGEAVRRARAAVHHLMKVEVEVVDLAGVDEALAAGADVILLDNMDLETMAEAVRRISGRARIEASGGVTLERLPQIAATGVDFVSMGALTHSARAMDISLEVHGGR